MNHRHTQLTRRLPLIAVALALIAPAPVAAGRGYDEGSLSPIARNDVAHFGQPAAFGHSSPYAANDRAHFGRGAALPPASPTQGRGPTPIIVRVKGGFDWVSAAVGAAGTLGLTLVVTAGASALRRRNGVGAANA
jgi:hypothetical protein